MNDTTEILATEGDYRVSITPDPHAEVYGYTIEQQVIRHTRTLDMNLDLLGEDRETGWDEVESVWGYYGREDAESQAREAFKAYTDDTESEAS